MSSRERLLREQVRGEDDASPAVPTQHGRVPQTHAALQVLRQGVRLRHNPGLFHIKFMTRCCDFSLKGSLISFLNVFIFY